MKGLSMYVPRSRIVNLDESVRLTKEMKEILMKYDEVKFVMTQTGRPNDGTTLLDSLISNLISS
jgi:Cu/Ag efflux pump CusA